MQSMGLSGKGREGGKEFESGLKKVGRVRRVASDMYS